MHLKAPLLVVVDMQRYYLEKESPFSRFHTHVEPGCLNHIQERCAREVIPNTGRLLAFFRESRLPVAYLRLCGTAADRSDLQHTFWEIHREAERAGFPGLYPLRGEALSEVVPALRVAGIGEEFCKTTYSGFTSEPAFERYLRRVGAWTLVFTGLATSQCVDTTARDAADRNYRIVHVDDAQADYSEASHRASLYSSRGVCGGCVADTETVLGWLRRPSPSQG